MKVATTAASLSLCFAAASLDSPDVEACGGCFSPPQTITSVDSHRMAISLSATRTILWDQIRYTGAPEDFVWVLPVPSVDATLAVADSLFFDELEAQTAVQVSAPVIPPPDCPPAPGGFALDAGAVADSDAGGVEVYREEVVGPYETVLIGSEDAGALVAWLNDHGYAVPAATAPTIQHYTDLHSKFIVLRLAPDKGVSAMQPVRVQYPGYMATLPLEMVKVGTNGKLALTLWVFAEQRYAPQNYPSVVVDPDDLVWDFARSESNYRELFRSAIDDAGGRAWVTQKASPALWLYVTSPELAIATANIPAAYLTRLETDLLIDHVDQDLRLGPAADASPVDNYLQASQSLNAPPPPECPDWDGDGRPDRWPDHGGAMFGCSHGASAAGGLGLVLVALAAIAIRRRA